MALSQRKNLIGHEVMDVSKLNNDILFMILSRVSNIFLLRLVCKNWHDSVENIKGPPFLVNLLKQLQIYFDTPKSQRRPLEWTFDLLSFLPNQKKYTLHPHLNFSEFEKLKKEISFLKGKGENLVAYTHLAFSEAEIQKLANKAIKKARKNKDLIAISAKLTVFPFSRDEWVSKNLLNLLLYALTQKNQGRIILKIIELSLSNQHLILGKEQFGLYLNNMEPITDEDLPKLFYMLMTTNQMNALELDCFKRVFLKLSKKEDGISDELFQVYDSLGINKMDMLCFEKKKGKVSKMKLWLSNYFLNLPNFSTLFHSTRHNYSFCQVNGFRNNGMGNVALDFSYAEVRGAIFSNLKSYAQDFSYPLRCGLNGQRFFNFFHADLSSARFKKTLISESDFRFSNMQSSVFHQADCVSCDFSFANFSNALLLSFRAVGCDFTGVNFDLAENEIIKIQLIACKKEYSKDWFVFLERDEGFDLCQDRFNHALLLALRAAQNLSWFSEVEKTFLKAIIESIEQYSNQNIKLVFDHYLVLYPDLCSARFKEFLNDLESGSQKFLRLSTVSSVESALEVSDKLEFVSPLMPDFIPKPENQWQQIDFIMEKFLKYFSEPLAEIIVKKGKFPSEIASCLHPEFKEKEDFLAVVRKYAESVLVYALLHPRHAKVCLAILAKAFVSSRIIFEKIQMTSDDMPKEVAIMWMVQALSNKIVLLSKIPFYQKAFATFSKQFPIKKKAFIFESYAKLYSVLSHPTVGRKWRGMLPYNGAIFSSFSDCGGMFITLPRIEISGRVSNKDFSRSDMSWVSFKGAKFHKVDFSNADLTNTQWDDCQFKKCNFEGADLNGAPEPYFLIQMSQDNMDVSQSSLKRHWHKEIELQAPSMLEENPGINVPNTSDTNKVVEDQKQFSEEDFWEELSNLWKDAPQDETIPLTALHQNAVHPDVQPRGSDNWIQSASSSASSSIYSSTSQTFFSKPVQAQPAQETVNSGSSLDSGLVKDAIFDQEILLYGYNPNIEVSLSDISWWSFNEAGGMGVELEAGDNRSFRSASSNQNNQGDDMDVDTDDNRNSSSSIGKRN